MRAILIYFLHFFLAMTTEVHGLKQMKNARTFRSKRSTKTDVVSHEFCYSCMSEEENEQKITLKEVHTYAELKHDPQASLPPSFTICSTVMTTYATDQYQMFFILLGEDGNQWLHAAIASDTSDAMSTIFFHWDYANGTIPRIFPHQWVRGCMAVNTKSGLLQWVVEGILVENKTVDEVTNPTNIPTDLTGKIVLGTYQYVTWRAISNKVTNLNIFSTALTVDQMKESTKGGSCVAEGDYLAWRDMHWNLKGHAVIETVNVEEPCMQNPSINLYPAGFSKMEECMQFCEKMESRSPPVTTLKEWTTVQSFLKHDETNDLPGIWLALDDKECDLEWKDYYNGKNLNFTISWFGSEPTGGYVENCVLMRKDIDHLWEDVPCIWSKYDIECMCERKAHPYLKKSLKASSGLSQSSAPMLCFCQ